MFIHKLRSWFPIFIVHDLRFICHIAKVNSSFMWLNVIPISITVQTKVLVPWNGNKSFVSVTIVYREWEMLIPSISISLYSWKISFARSINWFQFKDSKLSRLVITKSLWHPNISSIARCCDTVVHGLLRRLLSFCECVVAMMNIRWRAWGLNWMICQCLSLIRGAWCWLVVWMRLVSSIRLEVDISSLLVCR